MVGKRSFPIFRGGVRFGEVNLLSSVYGISTYIWLVLKSFTVRLILWVQKVNGCKLLEYNWSND